MSQTYFDGWCNGVHAKAEDWYTDNLIYINLRIYGHSTAISRPDAEKAFLLRLDEPERITDYVYSIIGCLATLDEVRDRDGKLLPISIKLPENGSMYPKLT